MSADEIRQAQSERVLRFARWTIPGILLLLLITVVRVAQLKVAPSPELQPFLEPPTSTISQIARRGDILDVRGRVLATSTIGYRLFIDPGAVDNLLATAQEITARIGGHPQEFVQLVNQHPNSRYVVLDDLLEPWQVDALRQARLRGVGIEPRLVREYPNRDVGVQTIGFVGFEHRGLGGAEHRFDEQLKPHDGRLTYLRDAKNRALWIEPAGYVPRQDGEAVRLSIDVVIQAMVEERLEQAVSDFNARGARAVVVDVQTGDILAMGDVLRTEPRRGFREVIPADPRDKHPSLGRNRCATDPYEPGSTFKPFIWSVATEIGRARPDEVLPLPEGFYHTSRGRVIRDVKPMGRVTWRTVLIKSLNSGMAFVGERMTPAELRNALDRFGFGVTTGSGIPGESAGMVTSAKNWTHYTQTSVPMGQEIAVTPLQMVRAFSAFCRDGTLVNLRLEVPPEDEAEPKSLPVRAVSEPIARMTREAMRMVMTDGTGRKAQSSRYQIFGKSGTAQLAIPKAMQKSLGQKGFFQDRYTASFIAGAPFENPRIIVLCVIDDPDRSKEHFGGLTAGPVARDLVDAILTYLGVEPDLASAGDAIDEGGV